VDGPSADPRVRSHESSSNRRPRGMAAKRRQVAATQNPAYTSARVRPSLYRDHHRGLLVSLGRAGGCECRISSAPT